MNRSTSLSTFETKSHQKKKNSIGLKRGKNTYIGWVGYSKIIIV